MDLRILQYGIGDVRIGESGDQDEDVDIDDEDTDAAPRNDSRRRNDAHLAGVNGGATGVRTGEKSMAGSTIAPREGVAVISSTSSHGQREQKNAGSQASIGRSRPTIAVCRSLPQPIVGEDVPPKPSDGSAPKVPRERTLKRLNAREFRKQWPGKISGVQRLSSAGLSNNLSKSVDKGDEDGVLSRERDVQTISKRKASETEPSTSTLAKRIKLHDDPRDSRATPLNNNKAEEGQPRDVSPSMVKEDSLLKRKGRLKDGEGESSEKAPRTNGKDREKRSRVLVLGVDSDEDMPEQDELQWAGSQKSDGKRKKLSGVKPAVETSLKKDSHADSLTKTGSDGSEKQVLENQRPEVAGDNGIAPFRSAIPLHAKRKVHSQDAGNSKLSTEARYVPQVDENIPLTSITCTKCSKERKVNADSNLKNPTWCCERNLKFPNCLASQQDNDGIAKELPSDKQEVQLEREARTEEQKTLSQTIQIVEVFKDRAQRNMVWVKLQVDGKECRWPGLIVTEVPPVVQRKLADSVDVVKAVRLFHPLKDLDEYQVVKRSLMQPFHLFPKCKNDSSHPDFIVAVTKADAYFAEPYYLKDGFSQLASGSNEGSKLNTTGRDAGSPHEQAESNEPVSEDVEMPEDDPQCSQPKADNVIEILEDEEVIKVPVEQEIDDTFPEAGNGSGLSDRRDGLQFSQPQSDTERVLPEDEEVNQVPVEQVKNGEFREVGNGFDMSDKIGDSNCTQPQPDKESLILEDEEVIQVPFEHDDSPEAGNGSGLSSKRGDSQCSPPQDDKENEILENEEVFLIPVEQGNGLDLPEAMDGFALCDRRDEVSSSIEIEASRTQQLLIDAKIPEDIEASERTKASEASGLDELYESGERHVLNLEISSTRRLIAYDDTTKTLHFQDGAVVNMDADSLGKELNKSSTGLTLHKCIHEVGKLDIRRRFPKSAKSSNGLRFDALDQSDNFAKRLQDTWVREYKDEPMPEYLKTRFVAGCILEERGEPVNWAHELTRTVWSELIEITSQARKSLSPYVHKLIVQLLEKQADQAPRADSSLPVLKVVKGEEQVEYDRCCQKCRCGGELLCCDGRGCTKTYHLKCLNPPLKEVPTSAFFCPTCSAETSSPPGVEVGSRNAVEYDVTLDDVTRQEPQDLAESTTFMRKIDKAVSPDSRNILEVDIVTTEAVCELPSNKSVVKNCISSAYIIVRTPTIDEDTTLVANHMTKDAVHEHPSTDAHGNEHAAIVDLETINVVRDHCVSRMVVDAPVGEESQIRSTASVIVESLQSKNHVLSDDPQRTRNETGGASEFFDSSTTTAPPLDLKNNDKGTGKESIDVALGSLSSFIPLRDGGAVFSPIQLVNRDELSGSRVESSLLRGFINSPLPDQGGNDVELDLEEGEISPHEQANASAEVVEADVPVSKRKGNSSPVIPQERCSAVELPYEEDEFPSSDDHNSICEGCDVGGELMYVTTSSSTPTTSSPFMLCDGKGCKVVYHKECLDPPLQTVPAGEWYCPECETKRKGGIVEKIWSIRKACSVVNVCEPSNPRGRAVIRSSDAWCRGNLQDQYGSDDEAQDDIPLRARFRRSSQRLDVEVAVNELGGASGIGANIGSVYSKDDDVEYLVQWKSRSHAHDKWVPEKELNKIAPKELARFKKTLPLSQVKYDSEWAEPDRVIQKRLTRVPGRQPDAGVNQKSASNIQNAEIEWFVKWKGLGYEDCTWEPADAGVLATSRGTELVNAYESWADAAKQRARLERQEEAAKLSKIPVKDLKNQPEWMIRPELLPTQIDALNELHRMWHARMNGILVYEASQEKIVLTIMFFLSLVEDYRVVHPILVVVPKSLIQIWENELYQWAPKLYIVNYASKMEEARDIVRRTEFSSFSEPFKPQIVLTTFEVINCDMDYLKKVEWEALVIDEGRRQRLQKFYRPFNQIKSMFRLLLLSDPLKSNVEELIQFVNFLEPRKSVFSHGDESAQVGELQKRLTGRVLEYIPKDRITEYWFPVEMTPVHLDQYYDLLVRHYPTLSRNYKNHQIQEVVTILRQSCNHPFLADPALEGTMGKGLTPTKLLDHHIEISGKMRLLHLMMPILKSGGWRVIIFSQETRQLDILERYMTQSHGSDSYERVDSDLAVKAKEAAIQRFNAEGSQRFVLLLKTGVHISFKNVQFVLIYDSDWNPANDVRALHKIHNEGGAGSKPLHVLRLYTHLTVEESTLILFRDKQLPPTRASMSAKICQKLLTWGASKIFDRYDNNKSPTGSSYRPNGAKFCSKAKLKEVVYKPEAVQKLLGALIFQEEGRKPEGDELLEAILVPRDEPAPLFAESDHPINMITGDLAEAFWASCLKWRHEEWQAKEVNMLGKGQRGRKRIIYDEDAMASAVYTEAQMLDENERKRPRLRKTSSDEEREVVTSPSAPVSLLQSLPSQPSSLPADSTSPVISTEVETALHSVSSDVERLQENTDTSLLLGTEVSEPAHGSLTMNPTSSFAPEANRDSRSKILQSVTPTVLPSNSFMSPGTSTLGPMDEADAAGVNRQKYFELMRNLLSTICSVLELPGPVNERVVELFKHIMQTQKNYRKPRSRLEIAAIELALVWSAADQLNHAMDKSMSITKVEKRLDIFFSNRPQLEGLLYKKVNESCANFKQRPAPLVVVSTTSHPALVHTAPRPSVLNHPPRAEVQHSAQNAFVQAIEGDEAAHTVSENRFASCQETGHQVEADLPTPVVLFSSSPSVQPTDNDWTVGKVTLPTDNAPAVGESHVAEVDTEVVLVEADPRLVAEEPLDIFLGSSRFIGPESEGRIVSSASTLEQGLGWVIVGPSSSALVADVVTPSPTGDVLEAIGARCVESLQPRRDWLQHGRADVVSALQGSHSLEVPGISSSQLPLESSSSLPAQTQVAPTDDIQPARQNEQAVARRKERSFQDRAFVIHGQTKEMELSIAQADKMIKDLKTKFDADCQKIRRSNASADLLIASQMEYYNLEKRKLERRKHQDSKELNSRQRADRDKLTNLYNRLYELNVDSTDVPKIELEIQSLKQYYSKFNSPSRSVPSIVSSTLVTEALPVSTVQPNGCPHVSQVLTSASPAEDRQGQHVAPLSSSAIPEPTSILQQQQGHLLQSVTGEGVSNSQRTAVVPTPAIQHSVQTRRPLQRSNTPVHLGPTPNLQRGASVVSRRLSTPTAVVPPSVGTMGRPAPASVAPQAGNATGQMYPDVLLKEKEKLNKEFDKAKTAYESESHRIKTEYDQEAELLHKKYEALLIEQHRAFTKRQQQVQQNIVKVEWNRQLAEALKLREELASRAAAFAGQHSQPVLQLRQNQQTPQQISGRPLSGGTAEVPVSANICRGTTNIGNSGSLPGVSGVTIEPPGTSSTRISTAAAHQAPRYGMPPAHLNEQPRSSMAEAMAALSASANAVIPVDPAAGISRVQPGSVCPCSPDMNLDVAGSPQPQISGPSPCFQDPILSIIRNSLPSGSPIAVVNVSSPPEISTTPLVTTSAGASLSNPQSSTFANPLTAGIHSSRSQAISDPRINPGADSDHVIAVPVQITAEIGSGAQAQAQAQANEVAQAQEVVSNAACVICLSDSDEE